jgi:hypothetical protein
LGHYDPQAAPVNPRQPKSQDTQNAFERDRARKARVPADASNYVSVSSPVLIDGIQYILRPAQIIYSQTSHLYSVTFPIENSSKTIRVSGGTVPVVKQRLREKFGNAVGFTSVQSETQSNPVSVAKQDMLDAQEQQKRARAREAEDANLLSQYRELCRKMSPEEIREQWHGVALLLMNESEVSPDFAGERHAFFQWPMEEGKATNQNWQVWVQIVHGYVGVPAGCVPALNEAVAAFRYGMENGHFFLQPTYKRGSEQHIREAVRPYDPAASQSNREAAYESAVRKLNAVRMKGRTTPGLPVGFRVTRDRAREFGLTDQEFEALVLTKQVSQQGDFSTLRKEVQAGFSKGNRDMTYVP